MRIRVILLALCLVSGSFCPGQDSPREVTNSDVIQMTKAGIGDQTLILAIQRGPVQFDTSPQGLIALKAAGVSDSVLNAIITSSGTSERPAPAVEQQAAQAIFEKALGILGNHDAVAAVHSIRWSAEGTLVNQGGSTSIEREFVKVFPDRLSVAVKTASGAVQKEVITPDFNYKNVGGVMTAIPTAEQESLRRQILFDYLYIAQHSQEFTVTGSSGEARGGDADELTVSRGGESEIWKVDSQTGRILSLRLSSSVGMQEVTLSDWRTISGVSVAFKRRVVAPGFTINETLTDFEINPAIDDGLFKRPAQPVAQGLTLRILQEQSVPYVQESNGGVSTSCSIVGGANTSAYANTIGNSTYGNATTTSNERMNCSSYDTTIRWPHVLNVMFAEGSDGNSYMIACDRAWRWSKCVPLKVGDLFNARFTDKGVEVNAVSSKGKDENLTYRVIQSRVNH